MRWNKRRSKIIARSLALLLPLTAFFIFAPRMRSAASQRLTVFAPQSSFTVDIIETAGGNYVDLVSVLQGLGAVSASIEQSRFKLRFTPPDGRPEESEFEDGSNQARIGRNRVKLAAPFLLQDRRGLIPVRSVADLLPHFTRERVDFHELPLRIYLGNSAAHFTLELKRSPDTLVFSFTSRVDPQVSVEGPILRLLFQRDPVSMATQSWRFDDPLLTSASFEETAAGPQITVNASEPLLAHFADGGKSISIVAAPKPELQATSAPPVAPAAESAAAPPATATSAPPAPGAAPVAAAQPSVVSIPHAHFLVLLDASHGGDERGAALTSTLAEKDVTLSLARRLRAELQNRGISTFLLRDNDATISLDQRAIAANSARPGLYVALHAGTLGRGVRVYTAMLSPADPPASAAFLSWETAQAGYVAVSRKLAGALVEELDKKENRFAVALLPAPVRPLNNIAVPALAVEVSPANNDAASLSDAKYQQTVAASLAAAIASLRPQLEAAP